MTQLEFEANNNEEYKFEGILDSAVYKKKFEDGHLPGLYYLVLWKGYPEEENTWKLASTIQHFRKLLATYH